MEDVRSKLEALPYLPTYLPTCLPICLPTYLPTYLSAYLPTYLLTQVEDIRSKLEALLAAAQHGAPPAQAVCVGSYHGGEQLQERHRGSLSPSDWRKRKVGHEESQLAERERTQLEFIQGRIHVVVANEAFGMGIDHQRIRRVVEIGSPKLLEQLLNHFGRAGRDGGESICTFICKPQDFNIHESYIHHDSQAGKLTAAAQQRQLGSLTYLLTYVRTYLLTYLQASSRPQRSSGNSARFVSYARCPRM